MKYSKMAAPQLFHPKKTPNVVPSYVGPANSQIGTQRQFFYQQKKSKNSHLWQ